MNLSRVAAKLLSPSDLTFFAAHYHREGQRSKQKAINLNADVFVDVFYPGLRDRFAELHFALNIIGPGGAGPHSLSRKAVRSEGAKNWRLNGEIVNDPPDAPGRFDRLEEGDIALFAFDGAETPESVTLVLISRRDDKSLYRIVEEVCSFHGRQSMQPVRPEQLNAFWSLSQDAYEQGHPLEVLLLPDAVEDAYVGTSDSQERTARTDGRGVTISPEAVRRQAAAASETGQLGEEGFQEWLRSTGHPEDGFEWVSQTNSRAAFDFEVRNPSWEACQGKYYVDVKTTKSSHDAPFHMSMAEVRWAAAHDNYRIARLSSLNQESAQVRILSGVQEFCARLLESIEGAIPVGVSIDSFEILPSLLVEVTRATLAL